MLKGSPSGPTTATDTAKTSLSSSALLSHPSSSAELVVVADASSSHVGAALHQCRCPGDPCQPLGFFSKKFDHAQISYCAFNRELLAAFSAIHHFRFQVESRQFRLWKDHRLQPSLSPSHIAGRPVGASSAACVYPRCPSGFIFCLCSLRRRQVTAVARLQRAICSHLPLP